MRNYLLASFSLMLAMLACVQPAVQNRIVLTPSPKYALVCLAESLNFRSRPGTDKSVEYVFPDGTLIRVMDDTEQTPDGATWVLTEYGWVNSRFLCMEAR